MKNLQSILEVIWVPKGADPAKTSTGARNMPIEMKNVIDSLRRELKDNGIELGVISSAGRDAYNQGRVMYANWFDLPQNQKKQGETDEVLLARRKKYITRLYRGRKSVAVDKIFADAYRIGKDGKGGIKPDVLKTALDNVETYLTANPISKHQGNGAIDVPSNSKLSNFINSGKSKYAKSCLPESNHLHIALNMKASATPYVKPAGTPENPIILDPVDIKTSDAPVDVSTEVPIKDIKTDKFVKLRQFFGNRTIKISPANVSDDDSKVKKTAVVEYNNSVYSLSQMLNEKFGDGLKRKANKLLKGKQRAISVSNSPKPPKPVVPTADDSVVKSKTLEKPTFNLIYDKKYNLIQIEASNGKATNYIGYGIKHVTDQAEQRELANLMGIQNFKTNQEIEAEEKKGKGSFSSRNAMSGSDETLALTPSAAKVVSDKVKKKAVVAATVAKYKKTHTSASAGGKIKHSYKGDKAANISIIEKAASDAGITNPKSIIGMLTVIGKESNFLPKTEKMKYSVERLPEVWSRFSKTGKAVRKGYGKNNYNDLAKQYANNASKLGNLVYSDKHGNGNPASGDGYKYRGRGFNQITYKGTYEKYAKITGKDIVNKPDLLNDPSVAAEAAVAFLLNRFKQKNIDPNSFTSVDDALIRYAQANAGWKSDATVPIKSARKYKNKFSEA